ncbi:nucleotidyl transferase AbiEii/AbiGii toxin family protein, partial [Rhizobium terrae]|uniref:nucleotidyl transferase AbiEii/AbiGii toxin family protein n=1 Tax=Rhizobium terrae TaxID=2171756 RepID=UPI001D01502B
MLRIVAEEKVQPVLVEKDYWIMPCLYGLQQLKMRFELKGGTSLSKGYRIINRFSEDIDIRIEPPEAMGVKTGPNHGKPAHRESRKAFYDWLAETIAIDGIKKIERDTAFDSESYRSGGIRLDYTEATGTKGSQGWRVTRSRFRHGGSQYQRISAPGPGVSGISCTGCIMGMKEIPMARRKEPVIPDAILDQLLGGSDA